MRKFKMTEKQEKSVTQAAQAPQPDREANKNPPAEPHLDYQDQPLMQGYMGIRLPNAPAPSSLPEQTGAVVAPLEPMRTKPHFASVGIPVSRVPVTHADPVPSPLPESVRNPDHTQQPVLEPVEQGEQRCATCLDLAMLVRRLCRRVLKKSCTEEDDVVKAAQDFLRRKGLQGNLLRDHFTEEQPAPSEPELPPLEKREYKDYESQVDDFLVQRQDQLLAALRENQQLRQQVEELQNNLVLSGHERNILKNSLVKCGCKQDTQCLDQWYNERAETAEQQLAQIRDAKGDRPKGDNHE